MSEPAKIKSGEVVLSALLADGSQRTIHLRCVTTPDEAQKVLLNPLGLTLPQRLRRIDEVEQKESRLSNRVSPDAIPRADLVSYTPELGVIHFRPLAAGYTLPDRKTHVQNKPTAPTHAAHRPGSQLCGRAES